MVFSNLVFLFLFLPTVLIIYFISSHKYRNFVLLLASLFFYAWGEPKYIFLMIFSIMVNYIFGLLINYYRKNEHRKKTLLTIAIVINLLILGLFKYLNFFIDNLNYLLNTSFEIEPIPLPIGISFFTFQAMSYIIDVYRQDAKVQRNFFSLSLYISLFPQLVAGPIVRYNTIAEQINFRRINYQLFSSGIQRFIIGLSKKVLLANSFGEIADAIFAIPPGEMGVATVWIGIISYSLQIYFDFSGYSDMAIGLGRMFGFTFMENFNFPYIAQSVSEFWRRWHISLSSWFRDYVYIPLGGNRKGSSRTIINLLIVWTITGFWHGAEWTFMAWGFYFGILIVLERLFLSKILDRLYRPLRHIYLLLIVMIGWVFFRATDFSYSLQYIKSMMGLNDNPFMDENTLIYLNDYGIVFILGIIFAMPVTVVVKEKLRENMNNSNKWSPAISIVMPFVLMILFFVCTTMLVNSTYNPFIYFRF